MSNSSQQDDAKAGKSVSTDGKNTSASSIDSNRSGQKTSRNSFSVDENEFLPPKQNPLSYYSSSTYNITLYMATPEAINKFIETGIFEPKQDYFIVAQSGGVNTSEKRGITLDDTLGPNKEGLDYFIDDFQIEHLLTGSTGSPTVGSDIKFKIVEPIGFNFFDKIMKISGNINERSALLKNSNSQPPPLSQNYLIGIRFYGYDESGNLAKTKAFQKSNNLFTNNLEPLSQVSEYATYERFFSFIITNVSYQLDGKIVTYHIEGRPISKQIGHGTKFGLVKAAGNIIAGTVKEALQGNGLSSSDSNRSLMQIMNEEQNTAVASGAITYPTKYEIVWGQQTDELQYSKISSDVSLMANNNTPNSTAKKTTDATVAASLAAQSINTTKRVIPVNSGFSVLQVMDAIMSKSDFTSKFLIADNDQSIETAQTRRAPRANIKWYSIDPIVTVEGRDPKTSDWHYKVRYFIRIQNIQYIKSLYHSNVSRWLGPHKKYDFFYTGNNTEILSFEQKYNNQYYILQSMVTGQAVKREGVTTPNHIQGGAPGTSLGGRANRADDIKRNISVQMNSIADQATAEIKIIGDPDFLLSNVGGIDNSDGKREFISRYGADLNAMNPYKNQIWIQINMKGAVDYGSDGTMDLVNVNFYGLINQPNKNLPNKIDGLIYRVIKVTSNFSSGVFTQTLELILVGEHELNLGQMEQTDVGRPTAPTQISPSVKQSENKNRALPTEIASRKVQSTSSPSVADRVSTIGGGRSSGRGGPTAQEISDWRNERFVRMVNNDDSARKSWTAEMNSQLVEHIRQQRERPDWPPSIRGRN